MTTLTTNYFFPKPILNADAGTWGQTLNSTIDAIDGKIFEKAGTLTANDLAVARAPAVGGTVTFNNGSVPAGQQKRWVLLEDTSTEGGGASGSNLSLQAYTDLGSLAFTPMAFTRSTGAVTFSTPASHTAAVSFTAGATFNTLTTTGAASVATLTATGAITPSTTAGIAGTATSDNANAGSVGEVASSVVTVAVGLVSGVTANVAALTLTAGDWDVQGEVTFTGSAPSIVTGVQAGVGPSSAALPAVAINASRAILPYTVGGLIAAVPLAPCRVSLSASAIYYLTGEASFASGTVNGTGKIWARRAR